MNVFRVEEYHASEGTILYWFATQKEADEKTKDWNPDRYQINKVTIPTRKDEMLSWLNWVLNRDNKEGP